MPGRNAMRKLHDRAVALAFVVGFLIAGATNVHAGAYEDALAGFTTDAFSDTADAIEALTATSDPRTGALLEALKDQRLLYSAEAKKVFIREQSEKLTDAATGEAVTTPPSDIGNVRLNNRVRGLLDAALGSLTLMAKEPGRRFDAAQAVFKSHGSASLGNIDKVLEKEPDLGVKKALTEAHAAIILYSSESTPEDKIAAITVIRDRGDQDALGLIEGLTTDMPPAVRQAALSASAKIQGNLAFWSALQNAWYGLSLGSVLLVGAVGLAITFGVMGIRNLTNCAMPVRAQYT